MSAPSTPSTPVPMTQTTLSSYEPLSPAYSPSSPAVDNAVATPSTHFIDLTSEDDEDDDDDDSNNASSSDKTHKRAATPNMEAPLRKIQRQQEIIVKHEQTIQDLEEIIRKHMDTIENYHRIVGEKNRVINKEFKYDCNDELHAPNFDIGCTNSWCTRRELKIEEDSNRNELLENTIIECDKTINQMTTDLLQFKSL